MWVWDLLFGKAAGPGGVGVSQEELPVVEKKLVDGDGAASQPKAAAPGAVGVSKEKPSVVEKKLVDGDGAASQPLMMTTENKPDVVALVNDGAASHLPNKSPVKLATPALIELGDAIMARLEIVLDTPVGPGMYSAFEIAKYRTTMATNASVLGTATTLWQLDLRRLAMPNTPVSLAEVEAYRK